jgi:hypothetical protein
MTSESLTNARLLELLGSEFISYCTNLNIETASHLSDEALDLTPESHAALEKLRAICTDAIQHSIDHNTPIDILWDIFSVREVGSAATLANGIRQAAGGNIQSPDAADPTARRLQELAIDIYPVLLIPPSGQFPAPGFSAARTLIWYPKIDELITSIATDSDLQNLQPDIAGNQAPEDSNTHAALLANNFHPASLIESIIVYAYNSAVFSLLRPPSAQEYAEEVIQSLADARSLARGHRVSLPVSTGLANLRFASPTIIQSDVGRLVPYSKIYDHWVPMQAQKAKLVQESDQGSHEFHGSGDIVFHAKLQYRLDINTEPIGTWGWQLRQVDHASEPLEAVLCLAATLGIENDIPIAVDPTWTVVFAPIMRGGFPRPWRNDYSLPRASAPLRVLSEEQAGAWESWISTINSEGLGKLRIATRRLQTAIAERTSPLDRFVDAVVVWENLFGSGGELTLRISASLAWLLGRDSEERARLHRELSRLYGRRSQVVHGGEHLSDAEAAVAAERALEIAILALRKLYLDFPELVSIAAHDRSLAIMLQSEIRSIEQARS